MKKRTLIILGIYLIIIVIALIVFFNSFRLKNPIKKFGNAVESKEKMEEYIDKYIDMRAVYALDQFMNSNRDIDLDDTKAVEKEFKKIYKSVKKEDYEKFAEQYKKELTMFCVKGKSMKYKENTKFEKAKDLSIFKHAQGKYVTEDGKEETADFYFYNNKLVLVTTGMLNLF